MPACYVTTPFGVKSSRDTGQVVDYDHVYLSAIRPAAELAGCTVMRADEDMSGGIFHKSILRMGIAADVFIADLGDGNANVMYEVGVRHASRRGIAVLIAPAGNRIPFNINYSRILLYQVDANGRFEGAEAARLRDMMTSVIKQALEEQRNDSPVFEFFPGYHVELPQELQPRDAKSRMSSPDLKQVFSRSESPAKRKQSAKTSEEIVKTTAPEDPTAAVEVLKKYRELGAWDDLIRFGDDLPPPIRELTQVQQMLALALNRRNKSGDQERAVAMMEQLVARTGGDGETYGILGRIYKDRFALSHDPADLEKAIAHYRAGFEKDPSDYYPGVNLVNLLMVYGDAGRQELGDVLPRVRRALEARMDPERPDYWDLATAMELAVSAGDWEEARAYARRIVSKPPDRWMIETTLANLERLEHVLSGDGIEALRGVEAMLREILDDQEARHA